MILGDAVVTIVDAGKVAILNQAKVSPAAVGSLHAATLDLFVQPVSVTGQTSLGDLTLPTWGAYAAQAITWNGAAPIVVDEVQMDGQSCEFTLPSGAVGQTIYGYAISDSTPQLIAVGVLQNPVLINYAQVAVAVPELPWTDPAV